MRQKLSLLFRWYFSRKALPYWCIFALDCLVVYLSSLAIYTLNSGAFNTLNRFPTVCMAMGFYLTFYIIGFRVFHTYSGVLRYSSFVDLQRAAYGVLLGLGLSLAARWLTDANHWLLPVRVSQMVVWSLLALMLMWAIRVLVKYLYDSIYHQTSAERVFIYGIRQGGIGLAKSLRNQDPARFVLSGFATDAPDLATHMLMGVRVHEFNDKIVETMLRARATVLFVSPQRSETFRDHQEIVNHLIEAGIRIFMVPREVEWDGKASLDHLQLREVDIEDLLPRQKIEVDMQTISERLCRKVILITGAAGSIGSEIVQQVAQFGPERLVLIDQAETPLHDMRLRMAKEFPQLDTVTVVADIANRARMSSLFRRHKPDYVFHAAAYKHVPMMEDNPAESIHNNVEGTRIIADLAVEFGTDKFVMISTDKAVNPTNVMGASKRLCEIYVQSLNEAIRTGVHKGNTRFVTTRFGNVLGSNGSVIPLFREQIRKGGPVTVTHPEIIRYFMLIPEACKLVLEAGTMGNGGEIFVFDMGQPVKIVDLARRMIKLSNANVEIHFTGLRDGEKLYEEVLNEEEEVLPTFHSKIKIARVRRYDYHEVKEALDRLYYLSLNAGPMEIVAFMKRLVPEYRSQHSIYEQLDMVPRRSTSSISEQA